MHRGFSLVRVVGPGVVGPSLGCGCLLDCSFFSGTTSARTSDPGASVGQVRGRWILKILNRQPLDLNTTSVGAECGPDTNQ
jgi:hypothetical protein